MINFIYLPILILAITSHAYADSLEIPPGKSATNCNNDEYKKIYYENGGYKSICISTDSVEYNTPFEKEYDLGGYSSFCANPAVPETTAIASAEEAMILVAINECNRSIKGPFRYFIEDVESVLGVAGQFFTFPVSFASNIISGTLGTVFGSSSQKEILTGADIDALRTSAQKYITESSKLPKGKLYFAGLYNSIIDVCPRDGGKAIGHADYEKIRWINAPAFDKTCP